MNPNVEAAIGKTRPVIGERIISGMKRPYIRILTT
jgi:hypothetical protein